MPRIVVARRKFWGKSSIGNVREHMPDDVEMVMWKPGIELKELGDMVFRWGTIASVKCLGKEGAIYIQNADAVKKCSSKGAARKELAKKGLSPEVYTEHLEFPCVVRPSVHKGGADFYLCHSFDHYLTTPPEILHSFHYISKYIPKVREYRALFLEGRVVWVSEKKVEDVTQPAWNSAAGAVFENRKWGKWDVSFLHEVKNVLEEWDIDFAAVDVMVDAGGRHYILEFNSAPSIDSDYRCKCLANALVWELKNKDMVVEEVWPKDSWKSLIHPGVWNNG